jgi:hypothetical protein
MISIMDILNYFAFAPHYFLYLNTYKIKKNFIMTSALDSEKNKNKGGRPALFGRTLLEEARKISGHL